MNVKLISHRKEYQFFYNLFKECIEYLPDSVQAFYLWANPIQRLPHLLNQINCEKPTVCLFIPDDLTNNGFNFYVDKMSWGAEQLYKFFNQHPDTKFILVTDVINLHKELGNLLNLSIVESEFITTLQQPEYSVMSGVINKRLDSPYTFLMLNGRASNSRVTALSYMANDAIFQNGKITIGKKFLETIKDNNSYLDLVNWRFDKSHSDIRETILLGYKTIQVFPYTNQKHENFPNNHYNPANNFDLFLRELYAETFVELIVETYYDEPSFMITEKTLHSILGCNFPIILGSPGIVDHLESLGFDVFRDIVNHSYDSIECPLERTITAIEQNRRLLTDNQFVKQLWILNKKRLLDNLEHCHVKMYDIVRKRVLKNFKKTLNKSSMALNL